MSEPRRYRWIVEFDAEDDADADAQVGEALQAFDSYHRDEVIELEKGEGTNV